MDTILIIDDDPVIHKIYRTLFEASGFQVEFADDGESATKLLDTVTPDIVLLDLFLPKLSGVDVLKHIRRRPATFNIPVLVFSSSGTSKKVEAAWAAGATKCLVKDHYQPDELVELVRSTLRSTRPSAPKRTPRVLIVDDDPVIVKVLKVRFEAAGLEVETAGDGEAALDALNSKAPDLVVLDLFIPKFNVVEVLKFIRTQPTTENIPVLIFSNAGQSRRMESAQQAGATQCLVKLDYDPDQLLAVVESTLGLRPPPEPAPVSGLTATTIEAAGRIAVSEPPPGAASAAAASASMADRVVPDAAADEAALKEYRQVLRLSSESATDLTRLPDSSALCRKVLAICARASAGKFRRLARLAGAVERLLDELYSKPQFINASSRRSIVQAEELMAELIEQGPEEDADLFPSAYIVATGVGSPQLCQAMELVKLRAIRIDDPPLALSLLSQNRFELVALGDGADPLWIERLRAFPVNVLTPVISVTDLSDFQKRSQTGFGQGVELIAKPFLPSELALKALTRLLARPR